MKQTANNDNRIQTEDSSTESIPQVSERARREIQPFVDQPTHHHQEQTTKLRTCDDVLRDWWRDESY